MSYNIFISYSTKDLLLAKHIKFLLENVDVKVFVAEYSLLPGAQLTPAILKNIETADLFLLLWSQNARSSEWVPQEIGAAKAFKKPVIPIMLQKIGNAPGFLNGIKYLPLYSDSTKALSWLQKHIKKQVNDKNKSDAMVWLGIVGTVLWALSQGKE